MSEESIPSVEPCESTLFSIYVNVKGELFPCSFTEGTPGWETGIDLTKVTDFAAEVWHDKRVEGFREGLLGSATGCKTECSARSHCRTCPVYPEITICKTPGVVHLPVLVG